MTKQKKPEGIRIFVEQRRIKSLAEAEETLQAINTEFIRVQEIRDEFLASTKVTCQQCSNKHKIKDLQYLQTHHYVQPYSCSGGDYWHEGEGQWRCPTCLSTNRLFDKPEISALKFRFKGVTNVY